MISRSRLLGIALVFASTLTATRGADLVPQRLSATPMTCRINPSQVIRTIPHGLYGTNLEWFNQADGISNDDGSVDPAWVQLAKAQGLDSIRFPGGTLSDFYHWEDGIGPEAKRPVREHPTDNGSSKNVFGTPEFLRFCQSAGVRPLITVNAGTGDAAEAARWVSYCNSPQNAQRAADGLTTPASVSLWEIGNELYLPGNPTDKKIITIPPDVYAKRFLDFATAMRAVDPNIKLIAIGTANASNYTGLPYPQWTDTVLSQAASQIDLFSVHNAYFPYTFGMASAPTRDLFQSLWAAPEAVKRSLDQLNTQIAKYEQQRHIDIAITEWGPLFSSNPDQIDLVKTLGSAVYTARLLQVFVSTPRLTVANYFKFTDRTFMGWIGYDKKPKVPYYVIQLFSQHFGSRLVSATIDSPVYTSKSEGVIAAESNVPELTSVAALDDSGKKLFVNLVNRSWDTLHQVKLDLGNFTPAVSATIWSISSPGVTDHNGPDMGPEIAKDVYEEPDVSSAATLPISIQSTQVKSTGAILVPPHSVVTVEFTQQ
jgi:alpha-N-arabinofuranosidase